MTTSVTDIGVLDSIASGACRPCSIIFGSKPASRDTAAHLFLRNLGANGSMDRTRGEMKE